MTDEPDGPGKTYGKKANRPQQGDVVRRHVKLGSEVPYTWLIERVIRINRAGTHVLCDVRIDYSGAKSLR